MKEGSCAFQIEMRPIGADDVHRCAMPKVVAEATVYLVGGNNLAQEALYGGVLEPVDCSRASLFCYIV
ncbi:hypothetical protein T265_11972 [Opisthorchis viverrini]|uniref:Uncharacterized protein n=1 Tax=Opisthorchis viverrini TaxID=6198 RepID=A0A074YWN2_OPIVI|nr:hypothetical protein T265_11972 [Opisthorchis viverrini]KER19161.1 hypothetical protein T265_11972 [Opisthorchis viverrini]